jgi:hypothetical protein
MDKRPTPLAWVYFVFALILVSCSREQTPVIIEKHLADYPETRKSYIYQSVLRLANIKQDPDFNKLIRDVKKITIYLPPREDSTYQIKSIRTNMRSEGYEELMDVRTADKERISLWLNESLPRPHFVGLLDTSGDDYIFEIDGKLDLEYISSVNVIDQETLRDLLNSGSNE